MGVTHPIPKEYAERIYGGKTVYIGKRFLTKVKKGDKFVIYESHGVSAYTGWADIISIEQLTSKQVMKKYSNQIMLTEKELKEYDNNKKLNVILFENFKKFNKPIKPKKFITMGGKYILDNEYKILSKSE